MKNKQAQLGSAVLWLYKFFILVVVIGATVGILLHHYSKQIDVRPVEASVIADKLVSCLAPKGKVEELNASKCLTLDPAEVWLNVSFQNEQINFGNSNLATLCKVKNVKHPPFCNSFSYFLLDKEGKQDKLKIEIAIGKIEKNES